MARKRRNTVHGWVVLDKPVGVTSTQAVGILKRLFASPKAGHAGTLDPLASGLLPVALGEATKTVPFIQEGAKVYRFTVRWGEETATGDAEGRVIAMSDIRPKSEEIRRILEVFKGEIEQVPPIFSAIKIQGARAYDLARAGEAVALEARRVIIHDLSVIEVPDVDHAVFETVCGKGTYIRALARDIARRLGTCGHVAALRRLAVGPFGEADMIPLEKLEEVGHKDAGEGALAFALRPVETALDDIPALALTEAEANRLRSGQPVLLRGRNAPAIAGLAYVTAAGLLVALCEVERGELHPRRVFNLTEA